MKNEKSEIIFKRASDNTNPFTGTDFDARARADQNVE
jgi:hypothetical protein